MGNKEFRLDLRLTEEEKIDLYDRAAADKLKPAIYARKLLFPVVSTEAPKEPPATSESLPPAPRELPPDPPRLKRNYTGEKAVMFHKLQYEYISESGKKLWTTEAP